LSSRLTPRRPPARGELVEGAAVDRVPREDGDPAARARPQRRSSRTTLDKRPLAKDRPRPDLAHFLAIDLDREHAVEQEVELVSGVALLDERLPLR